MLPFKLPGKKLIMIYAALTVFALVTFLFFYSLFSQKNFYRGVYIEDLSLWGLDKEKAAMEIQKHIDGLYDKGCIQLKYQEKIFDIDFKDISLGFTFNEAVDEAYSIGRTGNVAQRIQDIFSSCFSPRRISLKTVYDSEALSAFLLKIKKEVDIKERDASLTIKNGIVNVKEETVGKVLQLDVNLNTIKKSLDKRIFTGIELYVEDKLPRIDFYAVRDINTTISTFATSFNVQDKNRTYNMNLACTRLNGTILLPGDILSMNNILGPRTLENGYREAPVIFKNEIVPGTGGGICQVTTTLYNALLLSEFSIIERRPHSIPLAYVRPGLDATLAENYIDFKFQNNRSYAVYIGAETKSGTVSIKILGKNDEFGYDNSLITRLNSVIIEEYEKEPDEIIFDNNLKEDEKVVVREGKKGYNVIVYRDILNKKGELLKREKISNDIYKPVRGQIKIGPSSYLKLINQVNN